MTCPAEVSLLAASLLCPFRVARVSRLIGNSHTTVNFCGWQAASRLCGIWPCGPRPSPGRPKTAQTQEAPLQTEWRLTCVAQVTGLPTICGRLVDSAVPTSDFPAGLPLVEDRYVAVALTGCPLFLGWSELFQRPYITGVNLIAIVGPFRRPLIFNDLVKPERGLFLDSGSFFEHFSQKP